MTRASVCNWGLSSQQSNKVCSSTNCRYEFKKTLRIVLFNLTPEIKCNLKIRCLYCFVFKMLHYCVFSSENAKNHALKIGGGFVSLTKVLIYLRVTRCKV